MNKVPQKVWKKK